mmetsp:Transcript_91881/g.230949  ORF Transcript_91881/g.230949 Transcript_91881/m.230949 type:complete len:354 (+) Transcript_91881:524-1585(+)
MVDLQLDRRERRGLAHHGYLQRLAVYADEPQHTHLGRGHLQDHGDPHRHASGHQVQLRGLRPCQGHSRLRGVADQRVSRRPARGPARPGVPRGGLLEEHLRHGLLHAAEHRARGRAVAQRAAYHDRLQAWRGGQDHLCPRGQRGLCRPDGAVAEGQPRHHQGGGRGRGPRRVRGGHRRGHLGASLQRPLRALLAGGRAGRGRGHDALHAQGAPLQGCAGGRGVQHRGRHAGHEARHGPASRQHARRRRHDGQQLPHAAAERPPGRRGAAREDARGHGLGSRARGGAGDRVLQQGRGREGHAQSGRRPRDLPAAVQGGHSLQGVQKVEGRRRARLRLGEVRAAAGEASGRQALA